MSAQEDDRPPRPDFLPGGVTVVAVAAVIGAIAFAPLIGAPALLGGALAPLTPDLPALLDGLARTSDGAADPFAFVLALLGVLTPWQPSLSLVVLWIAALPLAALGAWWATAAVVRRPGPAAVVALLWALSPALLVALADGRPAAVIAHLTLPVLVASAARAPRSFSATAVAGLSAAVVVASSPSLLPALIVAWLVWMLANPRHLGRLLTIPVPTVALLAPLVYDQVRRGTPLGLLADPGLPAAPAVTSPSGVLLGWPDLSRALDPLGLVLPDVPSTAIVIALAALAAPLLVFAIIGLALPDGRRGIVPLVIAALGLVTAWAGSGIAVVVASGRAVGLDVGPALSLVGLGVALAAAMGLDAIRSYTPMRHRTASFGPERRGAGILAASLSLVVVFAAAVTAAPALTPTLAGTAAVRAGEPRTLPAIVAAEAQRDSAIGTIVLTPVPGGVAARVDRGAGPTLIEQRTIVRTAGLATAADSDAADSDAAALADLVGNLAAPSGRDTSTTLAALNVQFVLLEAAAADPADPEASPTASITAALDGNAVLSPIGDAEAGRLWRVVADDDEPAVAADRPVSSSIVLAVQLGILALTVLIALPTTLRPRRTRADGQADDGPAATFEAGDDDE